MVSCHASILDHSGRVQGRRAPPSPGPVFVMLFSCCFLLLLPLGVLLLLRLHQLLRPFDESHAGMVRCHARQGITQASAATSKDSYREWSGVTLGRASANICSDAEGIQSGMARCHARQDDSPISAATQKDCQAPAATSKDFNREW